MGAEAVLILAGARGAAGRMHAHIYESLGSHLIQLDAAGPPPSARSLRRIPWDEAILDICTPTATHARSMAWGYARGIRRFLVEKPAEASLAAWQTQLARMPDAQILVAHPYLFSGAYQAAVDAAGDITEITTTFDKDRERDDANGRGAALDGHMPHLFQVEAPHQLAMVLAALPGLRVRSAVIDRRGVRGVGPDAPVAGRVMLADDRSGQVVITTDLRSPRRRLLWMRNSGGDEVLAHFSTGQDLVGRAWLHDRRGRRRVLFDARDDLLRNTLVAALRGFRDGVCPPGTSAAFASAVLGGIDQAIALADRRADRVAVPGPGEPPAIDRSREPVLTGRGDQA